MLRKNPFRVRYNYYKYEKYFSQNKAVHKIRNFTDYQTLINININISHDTKYKSSISIHIELLTVRFFILQTYL